MTPTTDSPRAAHAFHDWSMKSICTQNPFYVVSAVLVLLGIRLCIESNPQPTEAPTFYAILIGYSLLLAAATVLVIRLAQVWEDARSLLLLHPLFFVSLSMMFDYLFASAPREAAVLMTIGLAYSIACSEGLLAACRIRLGWPYRLCYYLLLATLFAFPVVIGHLAYRTLDMRDEVVAIATFLPVCSLEFLLLLPGIWRGFYLADRSGTPFRFPWFPGSLFGVLGILVGFRAYLLAWSFGPGRLNEVHLRPEAYVPLIFVLAILLLEVGVATNNARTRTHAVLAAVFMMFVGGMDLGERPYGSYWGSYWEIEGPPVAVTLLLGAFFFAWAMARGVAAGEIGFIASLVLLAFAEPIAPFYSELEFWRSLPLVCAAAIECAQAVRRDSSTRAGLSAALLAFAVTPDLAHRWPEWGWLPYQLLLLHSMFVCGIAVSVLGRGQWVGLRNASLAGLVFAFTATAIHGHQEGWSFWSVVGYAMLMIGGLVLAGLLLKANWAYVASASCAALAAIGFTVDILRATVLARGIEYLAGGLICLVIGLMVSALKSERVRVQLKDRWKRAMAENEGEVDGGR